MTRSALLYMGLFFIIATVAGCAETSEQGTAAKPAAATEMGVPFDQEEIRKIDIHTHYYYDRDWLVPLLEDWNMRAVAVNTVNGDSGSNPARGEWNAMRGLHEKYPDRILLCTSFDASKIDDPNFADQVIAQLKEDIEQGAIMVKVWKNIGMVIKDESGSYIQIDDPRFQPIWDFLAEEGIPVLAHIGEPRAAWQPLDPESPHYTYYKNHPQYHNYQNPEVPSWGTIIEARDNWLAQNPELIVIGAHLGSMAYDVDEIAERLDKYPNFYVEPAERFGDLVIQPSEKVRAFFIEYQDRILYGTDLRAKRPASEMSEEELQRDKASIAKRYSLHWQYLTSADSMEFVRTGSSFTAKTRGLDLPREVVEKVYYLNAERLLDL